MSEPQLLWVAAALAAVMALLGLVPRRKHRPWRLDHGHRQRGPHPRHAGGQS